MKRALAMRPATLPEVEPELRGPPPRSLELVTRTGAPLDAGALHQARTWRAVKGWIVWVNEVADDEGPDYHIEVAWQAPELRIEKLVVGYDSYHWAVSYPEHFAWFHARIQPGLPITVLLGPERNDWRLYGQCEPFVVRGSQRVFAAD